MKPGHLQRLLSINFCYQTAPNSACLGICCATQALVLFQLLARVDKSRSLRFADAAEQQVLWKLEGQLEKTLAEPLAPNYEELVIRARSTDRGR